MEHIKLKDDVNLDALIDFGFIEDPYNCDIGDHYYHLNNYYIQIEDFRITVNTINRNIDILCLAKETGIRNIYNVKPLYDLITANLVEVK